MKKDLSSIFEHAKRGAYTRWHFANSRNLDIYFTPCALRFASFTCDILQIPLWALGKSVQGWQVDIDGVELSLKEVCMSALLSLLSSSCFTDLYIKKLSVGLCPAVLWLVDTR